MVGKEKLLPPQHSLIGLFIIDPQRKLRVPLDNGQIYKRAYINFLCLYSSFGLHFLYVLRSMISGIIWFDVFLCLELLPC